LILDMSQVSALTPPRRWHARPGRGRLTVYEAAANTSSTSISSSPPAPASSRLASRPSSASSSRGPFRSRPQAPLPRDPACIGLVTSPTGAAIQDFLNIARRRAPWVRIILNPVRSRARRRQRDRGRHPRIQQPIFEDQIDLLVVCRGGGSMEDLWAFNEEIVAGPSSPPASPSSRRSATRSTLPSRTLLPICALPPQRRRRARPAGSRRIAASPCPGPLRLQRAMEGHLLDRRRRLESAISAAAFRFPQRLLQDRAQRLDAAAALSRTARGALSGCAGKN